MKKTIFWFLLLLATLMLLTSCNSPTDSQTPTPDVPITPSQPEDETLKVLAIGNSFSVDAMHHLEEILSGEGYTDFLLGNLYVGGCTLDGHKERIDNPGKKYDFYINTGSGWISSKQNIQYGLTYADWDIVTIQQASGSSGISETYGNLEYIIDYVRENVDSSVKVYWHMTWAYQSTSNHAEFPKYDNDQMTMYNAIVSTTQEMIVGNQKIYGIIPSGTAIQNLRTSYLGDTLTRDGYHLSYDIGRYTAALVWYNMLTGKDVTDITTVPKKYENISSDLPAIKEAVNNAINDPFNVTRSTFTER